MDQIKIDLQKLKGKTIQLQNGQLIPIYNYKIEGNKITIVSEEFHEFNTIGQFKEWSEGSVIKEAPQSSPIIISPPEKKEVLIFSKPDANSQEVMPMLKGTLLETIKELRSGNIKVGEAKAIANTTQTLINLQMMELKMIKEKSRR